MENGVNKTFMIKCRETKTQNHPDYMGSYPQTDHEEMMKKTTKLNIKILYPQSTPLISNNKFL